jgi:ketosteroid isomerase-like protein
MLRNLSLMDCLTFSLLAANLKGPASVPDHRAAAVREVKELEEAWINTAGSKDPAKWASFLAEDAVGLYPGAPTLNGKAAMQTAMARYMSDPNFSLIPHPTQAVAATSGDMVYSLGTYTMTVTNPNTNTVNTDKGKYLTVYMKASHGHWKVAVDTFNSDLQS